MKKLLLFVILNIIASSVLAQTIVSGGIFSSVTWTKANSPYLIKGNVYVYPNVELSIEPGVVILMDTNAEINFNGNNRVTAVGTATDSIIIKSSYSNAKGAWGEWVFASPRMFQLKYARVSHGANAIRIQGYTPYDIENCLFIHNNIGLSNSGGGRSDSINILRNCTFINNNVGLNISTDYEVTNLKFLDNKTGAIVEGGSTISYSEFYFNEKAVDLFYTPIMKNCVCMWNKLGVYTDEAIMSCNVITENEVGVEIAAWGPDSTNKVCSNKLYNFKLQNSYVNLTRVCQCSTDSAYLDSKIYDAYDEPGLGIATYLPARLCDTTTSIGSLCVFATSVPEKEDLNFILYPNPMQGSTKLVLSKAFTNAEILIVNILGEVVRKYESIQGSDFIIDRGELSSGTYFILVNNGGTYTTVKMLIAD